MAERTQYGEWERSHSLGRGGQGEVFRARKSLTDLPELTESIRKAIFILGTVQPLEEKKQQAAELLWIIRAISAERDAPVGALKILHPIADQDASQKATARMRQELDALTRLKHPSLVRLLGL